MDVVFFSVDMSALKIVFLLQR